MRKLPLSVIEEKKPENSATDKPQEGMRIAWRYNSLEKVDSEQGNQSSNYYFDFSKNISEEKIASLDVTTFGEHEIEKSISVVNRKFTNQVYASVLEQLKNKLDEDKFKLNSEGERGVLRVLVQSLGSPLWWNDNLTTDLCLFLLCLKSLIKYSSAVCCVTVPSHLFQYFVIF